MKTLTETTNARYDIEKMTDSKGNDGEFTYIGIEKQLKLHVNPDLHELSRDSNSKNAEVDCNIDGFKVFKSSSKDAWVIACGLVDKCVCINHLPLLSIMQSVNLATCGIIYLNSSVRLYRCRPMGF